MVYAVICAFGGNLSFFLFLIVFFWLCRFLIFPQIFPSRVVYSFYYSGDKGEEFGRD